MSINTKIFLLGNAQRKWALYSYHIGVEGNVYMYRWLFKHPWGSIRLHHIMRSDEDRALHDHPMSFRTLLLTGSYEEELSINQEGPLILPPGGIVKLSPSGPTAVWHRRWLSFRYVKAETAHRLILRRPVWTLVFAGPVYRDWGFYVGGIKPQHWVDFRSFIRQTRREW